MPFDYNKICFVIMPFGKKKVSDTEIDFDPLYHDIFLPAIAAVDLPEGGKLAPRRTDQEFFTALITDQRPSRPVRAGQACAGARRPRPGSAAQAAASVRSSAAACRIQSRLRRVGAVAGAGVGALLFLGF